MSKPGLLAWAALSALAHFALWRMLPSPRVTPRWLPQSQPIEIALAPRDLPTRTLAPIHQQDREREHERKRERERQRERNTARKPEPEPEPEPQPQPQPQPSTAPPDLFPRATLERLTTTTPDFGGSSRRPDANRPPTGTSDDTRAADRVRRWLSELGGEGDASSGRVAPAFRDVERQIDAIFRPTPDQITTDGTVMLLAKQYRHAQPSGGPTPRALDPSRAARLDEFRADQISASQRAFAEPGDWRIVELDALVGADGTLESLEIHLPSGRAVLDRAALDAVRRAFGIRPPRDPRGRVRVRWSVAAAVAVQPPQVNPIIDPTSGQVTGATLPMIGFRFDANFKPTGFDYPLRKEVRTRTRLVSIEPAP